MQTVSLRIPREGCCKTRGSREEITLVRLSTIIDTLGLPFGLQNVTGVDFADAGQSNTMIIDELGRGEYFFTMVRDFARVDMVISTDDGQTQVVSFTNASEVVSPYKSFRYSFTSADPVPLREMMKAAGIPVNPDRIVRVDDSFGYPFLEVSQENGEYMVSCVRSFDDNVFLELYTDNNRIRLSAKYNIPEPPKEEAEEQMSFTVHVGGSRRISVNALAESLGIPTVGGCVRRAYPKNAEDRTRVTVEEGYNDYYIVLSENFEGATVVVNGERREGNIYYQFYYDVTLVK